jgi:trans-2,3-dihydro-3-hydroxyanthranilate isomerase
MKEIAVYHVDAFTDVPFGGNPAGVVPNAAGLSEEVMQKIARELNLSETAFLTKSDIPGADFRVRYFTPTAEIDFCGHATVGLSWVLATEYGWLQREKVVLETNVGLVPVEWWKDGENLEAVVMSQVAPRTREARVTVEEIADILGMAAADIDRRYPVRLGYTGNWHLLVPVKSRQAIDNAKPDLERLARINREDGVSTTHLFTFDAQEGEWQIYTRDFAPAVGIPEDPVTGSANGALAGYLVLEEILDRTQEHRLLIGQGHAAGRPGRLFVRIVPGEESPVIQVGGKAVPTIRGVLRL